MFVMRSELVAPTKLNLLSKSLTKTSKTFFHKIIFNKIIIHSRHVNSKTIFQPSNFRFRISVRRTIERDIVFFGHRLRFGRCDKARRGYAGSLLFIPVDYQSRLVTQTVGVHPGRVASIRTLVQLLHLHQLHFLLQTKLQFI